MSKKLDTFTVKEIKDWLLGNCFIDPVGNESCEQINKTIKYLARQLEDKEDGIITVTKRINEYRKEGRLCVICNKPAHKMGEMCFSKFSKPKKG